MNKEYWKEGLLHREGGPAISSKRLNMDYEEYWHEGQLHREDGPAVEYSGGYKEWWLKNRKLSAGMFDEYLGTQRFIAEITAKPDNMFDRKFLEGLEDEPGTVYPWNGVERNNELRLPLAKPNFGTVPRLHTDLYPWREFPHVGDQRIPQYLDDIFGGTHPFATCGDFGAMPSVMVEKLGFENLALSDVRYRVSYEETRWKSRFWADPNADDTDMDRNEDGPGILDLLGCYNCTDKIITLFIPSIAECAARLDRIPHSPCGPSVMTLTTLVFLHELGHAIHHAVRLQKRGIPANGQADDLGGTELAETVAQHFMMTCIRAHGVRAEWIEEQLERGQPWVYSAWRKCRIDTTWDGCRRLLESCS